MNARRRFAQLYNTGLNLGMREEDAAFYAKQILADEMERELRETARMRVNG
jgi:hypothetical protein